mgnify:CR=1 FL=1
MVKVYSDVTERNEAEEALRESEERYALVFQATRDDLYDLDLETDQNYSPTDPRPGTGFESWDGSGSAWAERVHPDDQEDYRAHYVAALKGEEEIFSSEYRRRQDDGSWRVYKHIWNYNEPDVVP